MFAPLSNSPGLSSLNGNDVHVWYAVAENPADASWLESCLRLLAEDELRRHREFRNEKARREYLVTRALVRTSLGHYLQAPPESLRFRYNPFGRPELVAEAQAHPLRFNVTHSDGLVACAVAWDRELGIDVESIRGTPLDEDVAKRHFSAPEFEDYRRRPTAAARHVRFLEHWVLKEAYLKARGEGLQLPLEKFSCLWSVREKIQLTLDPVLQDDASNWQLRFLKPPAGCVGAIAVRNPAMSPLQITEVLTQPV